jgi:hypothetical protein
VRAGNGFREVAQAGPRAEVLVIELVPAPPGVADESFPCAFDAARVHAATLGYEGFCVCSPACLVSRDACGGLHLAAPSAVDFHPCSPFGTRPDAGAGGRAPSCAPTTRRSTKAEVVSLALPLGYLSRMSFLTEVVAVQIHQANLRSACCLRLFASVLKAAFRKDGHVNDGESCSRGAAHIPRRVFALTFATARTEPGKIARSHRSIASGNAPVDAAQHVELRIPSA